MRPLALALTVLALPAAAQHDRHGGHAPPASEAGPSERPAALSDADVAGLLEGRGMGMASAAERNSYPGPLHVLELADALGLTDAQRTEAEALRAAMLAEAVPLGEQIVAAERHLDALFAAGMATEEAVNQITVHLGTLRGRLRAVHLRAHVAMRAVLTAEQVATYVQRRGYAP